MTGSPGNITLLPFSKNFEDSYKVGLCASLIVLSVLFVTLVMPTRIAELAVAGGIVWLVYWWKMTLLAKLEIEGPASLDGIIRYLSAINYVEFDKGRYRYNASKYLRFEAQNIYVNSGCGRVSIIGPLYILKILQQRFPS